MIQIIDRHEKVTLIYASKDKQHNSTAVDPLFLRYQEPNLNFDELIAPQFKADSDLSQDLKYSL